jgi:hypothetical protein
MNRREVVQYITVLLGGAMVGANHFLAGCKAGSNEYLFTDKDIELLDEIAETILPETDIPGAKAAKTGAFMALMVNDCYDKQEQVIFRNGMISIDEGAVNAFGLPFVKCSPIQKHQLLEKLDVEQKQHRKSRSEAEPTHYFRMMKELVLLGYFTSEIGYTQAKRYLRVPGRYEGCVQYEKGDKAIV